MLENEALLPEYRARGVGLSVHLERPGQIKAKCRGIGRHDLVAQFSGGGPGPGNPVAGDQCRALGRKALAVACHAGRWDEIDALIEAAYRDMKRRAG